MAALVSHIIMPGFCCSYLCNRIPAIVSSPVPGSLQRPTCLRAISTDSNAPKEETSPTKETRSRKQASRQTETEEADTGLMDMDYRDRIIGVTGTVSKSVKTTPPLICCIGAAANEFMPTVRVSDAGQMHPDIYSTWKGLQWDPPEFARAPGGPISNMAIALARMGCRVSFMGMVGDDPFGYEFLEKFNKEKVETSGLKFHPSADTGVSYMKFNRSNGLLGMECLQRSAENEFQVPDINLDILKEAKMLVFNSMSFLEDSMGKAVMSAIERTKSHGGEICFDLNLPMPLWKSRDETREVIQKAWREANVIETTIAELDFLLDEDRYYNIRNYKPQYEARSAYEAREYRRRYHYTREDLAPLWHDNIKLWLVTDATIRIHYYTPTFDGEVRGTEDVIVAHPYCDRTGSGDAIVAGMLRKLTSQPELYHDQDQLERQIRFAMSAGIIAQWAAGSAAGLPTERASQNLKESVFVPALW